MKPIYITLFFVIGLGVFSYFYYSEPSGNPSQPGVNVPGGDEGGTEVPVELPEEIRQREIEKGTELLNSAIITSNPFLCEQIALEEMKRVCIEQSNLSLALSENDPTKCDVIPLTGGAECRDQVYYQIAQMSEKLADCSMISGTGLLEKCTQEVEIKILKNQLKQNQDPKKNEKIDCETFTNAIPKEQCQADLWLADDQVELKDALENQSSESCESISSMNLKQECYDAVYFSRAKSQLNIEICDTIVNSDMKDHCKATIGDFSDSSLFEKAIIEQSIPLCERILSEGMKTSCIERIRISEIIKSGTKGDCSTLTDVSLRTTCEKSF